jgi:hypothetical protein
LGEIFRDVSRLDEPPDVGGEAWEVITEQFVKGLVIAGGEARRERGIGCAGGST